MIVRSEIYLILIDRPYNTIMKLSCIYDPSDEVTFNILFTFFGPEL